MSNETENKSEIRTVLDLLEHQSNAFHTFVHEACEGFRTVYNPITRQLREHIENCVLEKYQACIADE